MRRAALAPACLLGVVLLAATAAPARAAVKLAGVSASRDGDQVACRLVLEGLPDERQLQSMRSGMLAAIELEVALVDADGRVAASRAHTLRLGFNLWDEIYSVAWASTERRFASLDALRAWLATPDALAVAPWSSLDARARYRLHVGLVARAVATDERQRAGDLISGGRPGEPARTDRQEASVSLGRLIRFFYQGAGGERDGLESFSPWFSAGEVVDEAH